MQNYNFYKKNMLNKNFKSLVKQYKVKYIKYFTVDTESQALKIIKDITDRNIIYNLF